tara:strand:- start:23272 stop:23610 length:339 start_codon:yes stop_codon:yes gene_type:complete
LRRAKRSIFTGRVPAPSPINTRATPWCRLSDDLAATCITHNLAIYDRVGQSIERVTKTGHAARLEHPTPMHVFGCGEFDAPCQIEVRWTSGQVQQLDSIPLDQVITIEEAAL